MAEPVDFHPLLVSVRPARVAVRMGRYEGWEHSALRILEVLSVTWGGAHAVVITTDDDGTSHEQLWAAIELYDPDIWVSHVLTFRGYQLRDPEGFDRFVEAEAKSFAEKSGDDVERARSQIRDTFMDNHATSTWMPPEALWERTRERVAPYWDRDYGHPEVLKEDELPSGLLVDMTQLRPLPDEILVPQTDSLPLTARVLIASRWGALSPTARTRLTERGVQVRDVRIPEDELSNVLQACWGGHLWSGTELRRALAEALGRDPEHERPSVDTTEFDEHGPFAMSMAGLGTFVRPLPLRSDWPLVVTVGDAADDFALALALDRCMGPGLWVPPDVLGSDTVKALAAALNSTRVREDRNREIHLTSCSLDESRLEELANELNEALWTDTERVSPSMPAPLPPRRPLTVMDNQRSGSIEDEIFVGDTTGRGIRAQLPTGVEPTGPMHPLSWWNDVSSGGHQLPTRWPLNEHIVARAGSWKSRARVTRDGLSFCSHGLGFISAGQRLEQIVDSPRLRFLDAKSVFEILAAEAGLSLTESSAGRYASQTTTLWGGLSPLIEDLQVPVVRQILDAYQSTARSGKEPGNYIPDRRYLSHGDLSRVTEASPHLTDILDRFLRSGIVRRGLCLACPQCLYFGWYDASDVGRLFRCWRCRTETVVDSTVLKGGGAEPTWYYALAEVVYQADRHNFSVPVLALHQVAEKAHSVLGMTEHKVTFPPGEGAAEADEVEIDLWGIIDGRIVLGEAKSSSQLDSSSDERKKKAWRLRRAAEALTADTVVLATAQDSWAPSAEAAIDEAFDGTRCNVELLTGVDPHLVRAGPAHLG